jgi:hypothetical protein
MRTGELRWIFCAAFLLVLGLLVGPNARAQQATGAITGVVSDPSGAAVAGATVTLTDTDRGTSVKTQTNTDGLYNFPQLSIGQYSLRVEANGFQTALRSGVALALNQTAKLDFALAIGQVSQTLEVTAAPPPLQTQTTEVGTVMESSAIANLPLETGNYNQLTMLVPGAVTISPASFNTGTKTFNAARPNLNGNREQANYYLLDGMENNEFVDNNVAYVPSTEAINEFQVITNNPSTEYGQFLGGVINVNLKSGTNQFHGSLYEYLRNDFFNANEWSNNFNGLPTPRQRWNEYGGTVGGPIKHNKLFFFADYDGSRFDLPATLTAKTTFTTAERAGNLTDLGLTLFYPGAVDKNGNRIPMPSNLSQAAICGAGQTMGVDPCISGISATALKIAAALPTPNLPGQSGGTINNLSNAVDTYTHGNQGDIKMDWYLDDKDRIMARYSQQHVENPTVNSQALLYSGTGSNIFPLQQAVLDWTRTFSSTFVNDARIGMNYYPADANIQELSTTAGAGLIRGQPTQYLPGLSFANTAIGGALNGPFAYGTSDAPELFHQTSIQYSDAATWTKGTHSVRFGFSANRYRNNYIPATTSDGAAGQISFSGSYTGNSVADFFLGLPAYMAYGEGFSGTVGQRNEALGAFIQDDWRINSHLTFNYGLRWQLFTPIYEVGNRETNFGEYTGQIELAGVDGNSRALYNQYNGIANFLPRVGLAWSPDEKTVIRAAFGRTSFEEGTGEYNRLATNAPWNTDLVGQWGASNNAGAIPANQITLDQGFAALGTAGGCTPQNVTSAPAACFAGVRIHATDPNYRPAVSNQWNLSVQRELTHSITAQVAYVGQHSDHLAAIYDMGQNALIPNPAPGGPYSEPGPYLAGNPTLKFDGTGQQRLNVSSAVQNYDALQMLIHGQLSHGLAFQFNYTWGKCLTDNQGYYGRYGNAAVAQTTADVAFQSYVYNVRGLDYGYCDADITNSFNGYLNYDLPYGHGRQFGNNSNKFLNAVFGDWRYDTIVTVHGGFPISMIQFGYDPTGAYFQPRPDCNAPSQETPYKDFAGGGYVWFNPLTMSIPGPGQLGTCGISTERGPGIKQVDMSLAKTIAITERQSLQFRFDAINSLNSPIFAVNGYSTDVYPGGGINPALYGSNAAYTASIPTGVVNTSVGARNLEFSLKYSF